METCEHSVVFTSRRLMSVISKEMLSTALTVLPCVARILVNRRKVACKLLSYWRLWLILLPGLACEWGACRRLASSPCGARGDWREKNGSPTSVLAANSGNFVVFSWVIHLRTLSKTINFVVMEEILVGHNVGTFDLIPVAGRFYLVIAASIFDDAIGKFDARAFEFVDSSEIPMNCRATEMTPDGRALIVLSYLTGDVLSLDEENVEPFAGFDVGPKPGGLFLTKPYVWA